MNLPPRRAGLTPVVEQIRAGVHEFLCAGEVIELPRQIVMDHAEVGPVMLGMADLIQYGMAICAFADAEEVGDMDMVRSAHQYIAQQDERFRIAALSVLIDACDHIHEIKEQWEKVQENRSE